MSADALRRRAGRLPRFGLPPFAGIILLRTAVFVAALALWEAGYRAGPVDVFFFSAPSLIAEYLRTQLLSGALTKHLVVTLQEAGAGLALGFAAGTLLAWITVRHKLVGQLVEPLLALLNADRKSVV